MRKDSLNDSPPGDREGIYRNNIGGVRNGKVS